MRPSITAAPTQLSEGVSLNARRNRHRDRDSRNKDRESKEQGRRESRATYQQLGGGATGCWRKTFTGPHRQLLRKGQGTPLLMIQTCWQGKEVLGSGNGLNVASNPVRVYGVGWAQASRESEYHLHLLKPLPQPP